MILEKLKRMEGFTHQEQAVARYILDHVEEIQQMSTEELARVSYTSKATVVRLCKKLEVEGYQELKLKLVSEMVQNIRVNQLLSKEPITEKSTFRISSTRCRSCMTRPSPTRSCAWTGTS